MSSSSEKKDATSCVDIPKLLKVPAVVCRIGELGPAVGRVATAHRRFIWFFDEESVVGAFLLNKPGRSDTESGRCDGEMSSRRSTGMMGWWGSGCALRSSAVPHLRDGGAACVVPPVFWAGGRLLNGGFVTVGKDAVLTKPRVGVGTVEFSGVDPRVSSRSSIEKSKSCVESGGRLSVIGGG